MAPVLRDPAWVLYNRTGFETTTTTAAKQSAAIRTRRRGGS